MDLIRFALLGIGAGAAYVLIAQGIVLIYRGSGVLNLAQGGLAMVGAQLFFSLRDAHGVPGFPAFVLAVGLCALIGAVMQRMILRRLRTASTLIRLVSTLALLALIQGVGSLLWDPDGGSRSRSVDGILPVGFLHLGQGVVLGSDRVVLAVLVVLLTAVLWVVYGRLRYGLATSAVAENQQAAAVLGWSAEAIGTLNWAIGSALAGTAGILLSPIAGLSVNALVLTVIPGLAAALVGRFSSFWLTLAAGFGIAMTQSVMARYVHAAGWAESVPFLVIILFVIVSGRALPLRGELLDRPVRVGSGRINVIGLAVVVVALALIAPRLGGAWPTAYALTVTASMIGLSLVLITGYAGQISLAQLTIAGIGALTAAWASSHGVPFLAAVLLAAVFAMTAGLVVAIPALRCRGANLAVVTIGMSLCIESLVLTNPALTGGYAGYTVASPTLFGWSIDLLTHPARFALTVSMFFLISAVAVANVRRGGTGRRLLAVRSNERAAALAGIDVLGAKLYVFGLGSAIAGAAGALSVYMYPRADLSGYTTLGSITLLLNTVIGGVGYVASAVLGGIGAPGGVFPQVLTHLDARWGSLIATVSGAAALLVLVSHPHGIVDLWAARTERLRRRRRADRRGTAVPVAETPPRRTGPGPAAVLEVKDLSVSFGPVHAVRDVALRVFSGQVLGVIGPNGAGKTTVIDAISGLVRSTGEVTMNDLSLAGHSTRRRVRAGVGRTLQAVELFDDMTVWENITTAADSTGVTGYLSDLAWPKTRPLPGVVLAAINDLDLGSDLARYPDELPTGRRRLAGIARALASDPRVLLLDEPTAGLDDAETAELGRLIRHLADTWKLAILLVEHDINLVSSVCDQVLALALGEVIAVGTPAEVLTAPVVVEAYLGAPELAADHGRTSS
jgi:ABC-type branched-subunit amino acid transport system ATPase component/branched-subunit amino acid ABC-type transport system permease component